MIPHDFVDDLLTRTDIVDVIDQFVPLKKSGANYMARCPFHDERTPSFTVSPSKQFYHCFSCGAHGSAIGFLMEHQGLSFPEAVQKLADRQGLTVPNTQQNATLSPEQRQQKKQHQQNLEQTLQTSAQFYAQQLPHSPIAQQYLQKRGFNAHIIQQYQIGFAPNDWQALSQTISPYPNTHLSESGMTITNDETGRVYDRFRNRIMFPIRTPSGQVIGFGGRVLDDSKPKYLNSPDTPLFDKGKNLYGLFEGKQAIKEKKRILVVEGYADVVSLAQFGVAYAVASLGTATTPEQIKLLMRHSDHIYFCYDGDRAGKQAAWRALENALSQLKDDKSLHFLFLPPQHDPDSYVRAYGAEMFEDALLHQSLPLSEYFWSALTENNPLNTQENKALLVKTASPLIAKIPAPALKHLLMQALSDKTGIAPHNLAHLIGQEAPPKAPIAPKSYKIKSNSPPPRTLSVTEKLIKKLLNQPQYAPFVAFPDYLSLDSHCQCLLEIAHLYREFPQLSPAQAYERLRQSEIFQTVNDINIFRYDAVNQEQFAQIHSNPETEKQEFIDHLQTVIKSLKNNELEKLKIKSLNAPLSPAEHKLLLILLQNK